MVLVYLCPEAQWNTSYGRYCRQIKLGLWLLVPLECPVPDSQGKASAYTQGHGRRVD